jgi:Zn-dependent metalloprotease
MKRKCCKIIPDDILEKIGDKEENKELSKYLKENREFLQDNPKTLTTLKKKYFKSTHKEIRRLFDSQNTLKYSTEPIAVDEQIHSSKPSKYPALELANKVYDYFHNKFDLESWDNKNSPIDVHINFGNKYNNAFFDGLRMVFGNGDGTYFNPFLTQNIFTHEITHGITQTMVAKGQGLNYENQEGALNEHISDVFAVALDQKILKQKPSVASWLIGEGIFNPAKIKAKGLRTFKNELAYDDKLIGKDPQPKHMKDFKVLPNNEKGDWGGVHTNSGIPNRAFYEFCVLAETEVGDERINYSWNAPSQIWFKTYNRLEPNTQFIEFAKDTISVAKRIHPQLVEQLKKAWKTVGVLQ